VAVKKIHHVFSAKSAFPGTTPIAKPIHKSDLVYDGKLSISYLKDYQITETGFVPHSTNFFSMKISIPNQYQDCRCQSLAFLI
jgi:hypothetical protein